MGTLTMPMCLDINECFCKLSHEIHSQAYLEDKFLIKFYPTAKINSIWEPVQKFVQGPQYSTYKVWGWARISRDLDAYASAA